MGHVAHWFSSYAFSLLLVSFLSFRLLNLIGVNLVM